MITVKYVRTMARYNAWQNTSIFDAADALSDDERRKDRGAFFGSIHETLSHLLWADTIWMSRFDGWGKPSVGIADSAGWVQDWPDLVAPQGCRCPDRPLVRSSDRCGAGGQAGLVLGRAEQRCHQAQGALPGPFLQSPDASSRPGACHADGGRWKTGRHGPVQNAG